MPYKCIFDWAGCDSTFASKNEWKRHATSQHIIPYCWLCQQGSCAKMVNASAESLFSNGAIFSRKDLYTTHLRRRHTPSAARKLVELAEVANGTSPSSVVKKWENQLRGLQQIN